MTALAEMLAPAELDGLLQRGEDQLAILMAAVAAAWRRRDLPETQREAHKLAGLAGSIGCSALLTAARSVEGSIRAGAGRKRTQALVDGLVRLLPASLGALRDWRATLSSAL